MTVMVFNFYINIILYLIHKIFQILFDRNLNVYIFHEKIKALVC